MLDPTCRDVYRGEALGLQVLDRSLARTTTHDEPYAVISITEPQLKHPPLAESPDCRAILRLQFSDVASDLSFLRFTTHILPFNSEMARQVVQFVQEQRHGGVNLFVLHCEAGMSRSAGVATALSQFFNHDETHFLVHYRPNAHVRRLMLAALRNVEAPQESPPAQTNLGP